MANKIFKSILAVAMTVLVLTVIFTVDEMYQSFFNAQMELLEAETKVIAYGIDEDGISFLDDLEEPDYRITLIDADGTVIYDNSSSDIASMDNHLDRQEVQDAFTTGFGTSTRQSATLTEKYVYTATLLKNGDVVRLSNTYPSMYHVMSILAQPLAFIILLIFVISFPLAFHLTSRIVDPLNRIDMDNPDEVNCYREIEPMMKRLSQQQNMINKDRETLLRKRLEFETITGNMNEGMVLLSVDGVIIDINKAARKILGENEDILGDYISACEAYPRFADLIRGSRKGQYASKRIRLNEKIYEFEISPVKVDDSVSGYVLLIFDESYKEANEELRKEFASNVSHELKTPLQSILGYAELLKNGLVKNTDQKECYDKIYKEAQHMFTLVKDVIKVSHLEDEETVIAKENIDLSSLCQQIADLLKAEAKNVTIFTDIQKGQVVYANEELLEGIIYNLIENAIRYNVENGKVFVKVSGDDKNVFLSVEDTGIGIAKEDHERIFERFYRVDKARSKQVGGTGLGLSIVKHSCILNNATIDLESEPGKGSKFTVRFEKS
ncbi:MAG: PAS domain-containing protein [Erysipelotrichaceae bacterium]|nr:PAS domain-containing protein [Erysipelotrichaceae bacterium]